MTLGAPETAAETETGIAMDIPAARGGAPIDMGSLQSVFLPVSLFPPLTVPCFLRSLGRVLHILSTTAPARPMLPPRDADLTEAAERQACVNATLTEWHTLASEPAYNNQNDTIWHEFRDFAPIWSLIQFLFTAPILQMLDWGEYIYHGVYTGIVTYPQSAVDVSPIVEARELQPGAATYHMVQKVDKLVQKRALIGPSFSRLAEVTGSIMQVDKKPGDKARTVCDGTMEKLAVQMGLEGKRVGTNRYQLPLLATCIYPNVQWFIILALHYSQGWGFGGDVDSACIVFLAHRVGLYS